MFAGFKIRLGAGSRAAIAAAALFAGVSPLGAQSGEVIPEPNPSTPWVSWLQGPTAYAEVTGANPRLGFGNRGDGSLQMSVGGDMQDWAFWYRFAAEGGFANRYAGSFGSLSALTTLSFDWYRVGLPSSLQAEPDDWAYKTPVLRLMLREQFAEGGYFTSELVWEGYFNRGGDGAAYHTPLNTWVESGNLAGGNFWYYRLPESGEVGSYLQGACQPGALTDLVQVGPNPGGFVGQEIPELFGPTGCFAGNVEVIGIAVGLGSNWPLPYSAFVDNVRLGFGQESALNANFDFVPTVVPEPSSIALLGLGLAGLGFTARRRRR